MRIAIVSDLHANLAALESIREPYDLLFCLGDLVDYGPQSREAIHWVRERALRVVRRNHDHALAYKADCRCAPVMREGERIGSFVLACFGRSSVLTFLERLLA
jgi:hypothetical protein